MPQRLLDGRVCVVTGGASGIGRGIALAFADHGAKAVVVADVLHEPREGGQPTHEDVRVRGAESVFVATDVSDISAVQRAVDAAEQFGGVDVMVNNAGVFRPEPFLEVGEDDYAGIMDVNVKGVFFGAQAAARAMVAGGRRGSIINMSSIAGIQGHGGFVTYSASKGAVKLMTQALCQTFGEQGIRVNSIHPGLIETRLTTDDVPVFGSGMEDTYLAGIPLRRAGTPADIAGAAVFLASDLAAYVTGAAIVVDGGFVACQ